MPKNFKKYGKNVDFIKFLIDKKISEGTKIQTVFIGGGRSYGSGGSNIEQTLTKIVFEAFGGPFGLVDFQELVQRSGVIPKGGLMAEDDEANDRVNLYYEMFSDPNYWIS